LPSGEQTTTGKSDKGFGYAGSIMCVLGSPPNNTLQEIGALQEIGVMLD
jgi:hypothetical protein